ncbi:hypothetical protein FHR83_005563 [Actinoplanes campanulatus]|uniref:Uncharacterized protein n=1 Tax=Actinoplanes campanulatus TaxID=113559 RepID=A0A7W5AL55_9ACTN|nr:hypothetical protein [Actinoplanes campanulatus]MBB3097879.1 hypothetical protein [Actinoplanes campanulatus]GGN22463.1 hypothetical protein GCM10010109_37080 [Actinoplanes campanulatus]GID34568.1 hypothetical protein Aca09nite_10740 [Actinoplanes campanulatus]
MRLEIEDSATLTFDDGSPVRSASAIASFGDGWLVVQDDATHAAWWRPDSITPVRVIDPIGGLDEFSAAAGTKHLKPDFEAACALAGGQVLLLGSGSSPNRMRASLVGSSGYTVADLRPLYLAVAAALGLAEEQLNLEGACLVGDRLRWFQRGNLTAGAPSASADVDAAALLAAVRGEAPPDLVRVGEVRVHDLGDVDGVAFAVTDAVTLPDGRVLVSAAAEDTPNAVDDGPVLASGLALLDGGFVEIPGAEKVEGLTIREVTGDGVRLHAVVDADDYDAPSRRLALRLILR